jgi:diketogulonate reductase-like aldo/keto reductase
MHAAPRNRLGLTHIDTAEMYGSGMAEQVIAKAIEGRRDEIFLVSKVLPSNASRKGVVRACEATPRAAENRSPGLLFTALARHHPLQETVAAFDQLISEGKILSWGVSNFDVDDLKEVYSLSAPRPPECNQVLYHLQERAIEHAVIPWCSTHGIAVVAYSPFGSQSGFPAPRSAGGQVLQEIADAAWCHPASGGAAFFVAESFSFRNS